MSDLSNGNGGRAKNGLVYGIPGAVVGGLLIFFAQDVYHGFKGQDAKADAKIDKLVEGFSDLRVTVQGLVTGLQSEIQTRRDSDADQVDRIRRLERTSSGPRTREP